MANGLGDEEWSDSDSEDSSLEGRIKPLEIRRVYKAVVSNFKKDYPVVKICTKEYPDLQTFLYWGFVVKSVGSRLSHKSNKIREGLGVCDEVNVLTISPPRRGDLRGPYRVIAIEKSGLWGKGERLDMTCEEAHAVLKGDGIFHARYIRTGIEGGPTLRVWRGDGTRGFGFLNKVCEPDGWEDDEKRLLAESKITRDIINGSEEYRIKALKVRDYLIARQTGKSNRNDTLFFEPAVNLMEGDGAWSPDGTRRLITTVDGYSQGDIIHNLPLLTLTKTMRGETTGLGYVERPEDNFGSFYYKPVFVVDGVRGREIGNYKGKLIPETRIIKNGESIILTQMVR